MQDDKCCNGGEGVISVHLDQRTGIKYRLNSQQKVAREGDVKLCIEN
jgi:hypothetical protein